MKAIVPNKDTIFLLNNMQREICRRNGLIPQFPLWVIADEIPEHFSSIIIKSPERDEESVYFPVQVNTDIMYRIHFASYTNNKEISCDLTVGEGVFPKSERVFRTGNFLAEENSWKLTNAEWHKIK